MSLELPESAWLVKAAKIFYKLWCLWKGLLGAAGLVARGYVH
jgi:hypothetical protein